MEPASTDTRLSNYRIERPLGAGGMGTVYLARDLALDRPVALKFITPDRAGDPTARRRLLREARAAAALEHPNICGIHEVIDVPDGRACIVMQYVEGEPLSSVLRRGPLDARAALSVAAELASALSLAHRHGIVHRDLKPQNVILTPDRHAKLLDFGLAIQTETAGAPDETTVTSLTGPGLLAGTPAYMSPEQIQGLPVDGRSDLFSLGCVLYECLTGRRPFSGPTSYDLGHQILHVDPTDPSSLQPGLQPHHDELCRRLLAKDREDRFQSADELLGALRLSTSGTTLSRHPGGGRPTHPSGVLGMVGLNPWRGRRFAAIALLAAATGALVGFAAWSVRGGSVPASETSVIGVLPFRNDSGDPANDPLAAGLTAGVARRLASVGTLQILPLDETREAAREQAQRGTTWQPADLAAMARTLGARYVVDGAITRGPSGRAVITTLVAADGTVHAATPHAGAGSVLDLHRRAAGALISALRASGAVSAGDTGAELPTDDADAFAEYSQGRLFLERPDVPGNLDHAVRLFSSAIAKDAGFALAHAGLADAYWAQFQETQDPAWTASAMGANIDALRIDPDQPEVRMSLALAYNAQGQHEKAIDELKRVLAMQPRSDAAHRVLADIHTDRAEWDAAIAEARQAVDLRPGYWRNHHQLGLTYFSAGRYDQAATAFARVVELQPDSARGHQTLGTALQAAGRNDEALRQYEQAIAIRPSGRTYSNVGTLYFWRGDFARAADAYEKAVSLLPNDPELHANLGDAYKKLGHGGRAREAYRRAIDQVQSLLAVSPNDAHRLAALGLYQAKLGEPGPARTTIEKALALGTRDGELLYASALVHALAGDVARSCTVLAEAVARGASLEEIRHADELRALQGCAAYDKVLERREGQED